jgi:hypothetical protein
MLLLLLGDMIYRQPFHLKPSFLHISFLLPSTRIKMHSEMGPLTSSLLVSLGLVLLLDEL